MRNEIVHSSPIKENDLVKKVKELIEMNSYYIIIEICKDSPFLSKRIELTQYCSQSYAKLRKYEKAIEVIENYFTNRTNIKDSEREYECLINLSDYYLNIKMFDKANDSLKKAKSILNSKEFRGNTNFEYERLNNQFKRIENSKNNCFKNKQIENNKINDLISAGRGYFDEKKYNESLKCFQKIIDVYKDIRGYYYLGYIYYTLLNFNEAINYFSKFLDEAEVPIIEKKNRMFFNNFLCRAFSFLALEDIDKAQKDFEVVLTFDSAYLTKDENDNRHNLQLSLENIIHIKNQLDYSTQNMKYYINVPREYNLIKSIFLGTSITASDISNGYCYIVSNKWISRLKCALQQKDIFHNYLLVRDSNIGFNNFNVKDDKRMSDEETRDIHESSINQMQEIAKEIGPIYNIDILEFDYLLIMDPMPEYDYMNIIIKKDMEQNTHFTYLTFNVWEYLMNRFGGYTIKRKIFNINNKIIVDCDYIKLFIIVFPLSIASINADEFIYISRYWKAQELFSKLRRIICERKIVKSEKFENKDIQIWKLSHDRDLGKWVEHFKGINLRSGSVTQINAKCLKMKGTVESLGFSIEDIILIEVISGGTQIKFSEIHNINSKNGGNGGLCDIVGNNSRGGAVGLRNLGNTCYMNSGIQCLSHTSDLTNYFLLRHYKKEINTKNPIGSKGKIAQCYFELLQSLWISNENSTDANDLKIVISKKIPLYGGYEQQDSQEFVNAILDFIHEDLNRVIDKPYLEKPEFINKEFLSKEEEKKASLILWNYFLSRNQSVIIDLFYGQLKSRISCPICKTISITFDPFLTLSIPIPLNLKIEVIFIPFDFTKRNIKITLAISESASFRQLEEAIINSLKLEKSKILFAEISKGRISQFFPPSSKLSKNESIPIIFAYEILTNSENFYPLEIGFNYHKKGVFGYSYKNSVYPQIIMVNRSDSFLSIQNYINSRINNLMHFIANSKASSKKKAYFRHYPDEDEDGEYDSKINRAPETEFYIKIYNNLPSVKAWIIMNKKAVCEFCHSSHEDDCDVASINPEFNINNILEIIGNKRRFALTIELDEDEIMSEKLNNFFRLSENETETFNINASISEEKITLENCLESFSNEEQLDEGNLWNCPNCKKAVQAFKKMEIYKLPRNLIIHLKRFSLTRKYGEFHCTVKNSSLVLFPVTNLKMGNYCINNEFQDSCYDLYAVTNHYGGLRGGHYTASCLNPKFNKWLEFNDSSVTRLKENEIISTSAYLLFYKRINS